MNNRLVLSSIFPRTTSWDVTALTGYRFAKIDYTKCSEGSLHNTKMRHAQQVDRTKAMFGEIKQNTGRVETVWKDNVASYYTNPSSEIKTFGSGVYEAKINFATIDKTQK